MTRYDVFVSRSVLMIIVLFVLGELGVTWFTINSLYVSIICVLRVRVTCEIVLLKIKFEH